MGYARATRKQEKDVSWAEAFRNVFGPAFRRLFSVVRFLFRVLVSLFRFLFFGTSRKDKQIPATSVRVEVVESGEDLATDRQRAFIAELGGVAPDRMTKREASSLIDELLIQKEERRLETARRRVERRHKKGKDFPAAGAVGPYNKPTTEAARRVPDTALQQYNNITTFAPFQVV